jgi:hypothetical protein
MRQHSFTVWAEGQQKRVTRKDEFLQRIEALIPWRDPQSLIERHYPKIDKIAYRFNMGRVF